MEKAREEALGKTVAAALRADLDMARVKDEVKEQVGRNSDFRFL